MQIRREDQNPLIHIHGSRRGKTHSEEVISLSPPGSYRFLDDVQRLLDHLILIFRRLGIFTPAPDDVSKKIRHRNRHEIHTEFHANDIPHLWVDFEQRCGASRSAHVASRFMNEIAR